MDNYCSTRSQLTGSHDECVPSNKMYCSALLGLEMAGYSLQSSQLDVTLPSAAFYCQKLEYSCKIKNGGVG